MQIESESNWTNTIIELMKCFENIKKPINNKETGSLDYIIDNPQGKKLIRSLVTEDNSVAPAYVENIRTAIKELEEKNFDEVIILTNRITNSAYDLASQMENLVVITPNTKHSFSLVEVLSAVEKKTIELCKIKCGKAPETKDDCKGRTGMSYHCDIRRISDDATFHATMKWKQVLIEDFNNLCQLENEMNIS
jgi:hypothetical protein